MPVKAAWHVDEARTKWCPFGRKPVWIKPDDWKQVSANRGEKDELETTCIASDCMAWRFTRTHIKNPDDPKGDLIESGDTHGYCGLAGKP